MNVAGKEQCTSIKSFRRHLEKKVHQKINNDNAARVWIKSGLSIIWRKAFSRNDGT